MQTRTERIQKDIETLAQFTSTPGKGVTRSSYSKEDTMAQILSDWGDEENWP
ncbi:MAG: hypothetical protein ACLR0U_29235 [Enterocloster clostridioformis]